LPENEIKEKYVRYLYKPNVQKIELKNED